MGKTNILERIGIYFVVPCILGLGVYYIMMWQYESIVPLQTVKWQDLLDKNTIISVDEIEEKQFDAITIKRDDVSISSDNLDKLLIEYGADPKGMDPQNIKQKIDLLLKISSPDFWRKNYLIHPQNDRVKTWIAVHQRYLDQIKSINKMSEFVDISEKIKIHNEFEEEILFKFIRDDLNLKLDVLPVFMKQHEIIHDIANNIRKNEKIDNNLLQKYEKALIEHFMNEEQNIVHIMLNIPHFQYIIYKGYWRCSRYHPDRCAHRFL